MNKDIVNPTPANIDNGIIQPELSPLVPGCIFQTD